MRRTLISTPLKFLAAASMMLCVAALAFAQTRDPRLISAQAGGVNFVAGNVTLIHAGAESALAPTDELRPGDVVKTGADGRCEVLLNPGSYLRVGANADFELTDTSLDHLSIKLNRGSAIIEAIGFDDPQFNINVNTPRGRVALIRAGLYRINVAANGATDVAVYKGRATVGATATIVKAGQKAVVGQDSALALAKLDKNDMDALDVWSRARAEELAQANSRLMRNATAMNTLVSWQGWDSFYGDPWFNSLSGFWLYGGRRGYIYVPCTGDFVNSPYGFHYNCRCNGRPWLHNRCHDCPPNAQTAQRGLNNNGATVGNQPKVVNQSKYNLVTISPVVTRDPISKFPGGGAGSSDKFPAPNVQPPAQSAPMGGGTERTVSEPRSMPASDNSRGGMRPPL
ncbi:MAG: hypothetical protein DMF64_13640 [Acidobacteria bacterium]|nr:MAG: hypothetical protein DMF64_13640 [Acidobacteriota bacterium]